MTFPIRDDGINRKDRQFLGYGFYAVLVLVNAAVVRFRRVVFSIERRENACKIDFQRPDKKWATTTMLAVYRTFATRKLP
jgi:hypothetical protein